VNNNGGGAYVAAIYNGNASPSLLHVTTTAAGGTGGNFVYGILNNSASPAMTNVTSSFTGDSSFNVAIGNYHSSAPTMINVTATVSGGSGNNYGLINNNASATLISSNAAASGGIGSYGMYNFNSVTIKIDHSVIKGGTNAIGGSSSVYVGYSRLEGPVSASAITACIGAYNASYGTLNSSCQ
jgi:hypothetical protein